MDPFLLPVAPPTLPPAKPTKIFGMPARWLLMSWCLIVLIITPFGIYKAKDICTYGLHEKPVILYGSLYSLVYSVFFLAFLFKCKRDVAENLSGLAPILAFFDLFLLFIIPFKIAETYFKIWGGQVTTEYGHEIIQEDKKYIMVAIILLTFDGITAAMIPRSIRDMYKPSDVVAPESVALTHVPESN